MKKIKSGEREKKKVIGDMNVRTGVEDVEEEDKYFIRRSQDEIKRRDINNVL